MIDRDRLGDHPLREIGRETDVARTEAALDDIFAFEQTELEREDIRVEKPPTGSGGARVDKTRHLTDGEFDTYRERASESPALSFNPVANAYTVNPAELPVPQPLEVFNNRDSQERQADIQRQAEVTTDPEKYAEHPNHYDWPFLDTTKEWDSEYTEDQENTFPVASIRNLF